MEKLLRNFVKASAKLYYNTILNKKETLNIFRRQANCLALKKWQT